LDFGFWIEGFRTFARSLWLAIGGFAHSTIPPTYNSYQLPVTSCSAIGHCSLFTGKTSALTPRKMGELNQSLGDREIEKS
jgi:hypothetical protein